jgi:hypothetical protein
LLQQVVDCQAEHYGDGCGLHLSMITLAGRIKDALSQQPEPVRSPRTEDTASMDSDSAQEQFTAVDMATAAAQGFRDGQAAVEPAPAQDERKTFEAWAKTQGDKWLIVGGLQWSAGTDDYASARTNAAWAAWQERAALSARPAQAERQPISRDTIRAVFLRNGFTVKEGQVDLKPYVYAAAEELLRLNAATLAQTEQQPVATWMGTDWNAQQQLIAHLCKLEPGTDLYAAPIAQTAPQPEQSEELAWKVLQAATDALDRRAAPHAWISQAWNAGSEVITSRRAAKPTQGASEQ